jgi:hypothetical protein
MDATTRLPDRAAKRLLAHMGSCFACHRAKVFPGYHYCTDGQALIFLTLKERHG